MGAALPLGLPFRWVPSLPSSRSSRAPAVPSWEPRRWAPHCRWGCRSGGRCRCHPGARQWPELPLSDARASGPSWGGSTVGAALPLGLSFRWAPPLSSSGSSRAPAGPSWGASTMGAALPLGLPFRWVPSLPSWRAPAGPSCRCPTHARQRAELGRLDGGRRAAVGAAVPVGAVAAFLARASGPSCRCPTHARQRGRAGRLDDGRRAAVGAAVPVGAVAAILGLQPRASGPSWEPRRWAPRCRWGCRSGGFRRCLPRAPAARQRCRAGSLDDGRRTAVGAAVPVGAAAAILARASGPSCRCPTRAPAGRAGEARRWAPRCRWGCRSGGCRRCHPRAPAARQRCRVGEPRRWAPPLPSLRSSRAPAGPSWGASTMGAALPSWRVPAGLSREARRWAPRCRWGRRSGGCRRCLPGARQRGRAAVVRRARQRAELGGSTMGAILASASGAEQGGSTMGAALPSWRASAGPSCRCRTRAPAGRAGRLDDGGRAAVGAAVPVGAAAAILGLQPRASGAELGSLDGGRRAAVGAAVPVGVAAVFLARSSGAEQPLSDARQRAELGSLDDGRRAAVGAVVPVGAAAVFLGLQPRASGAELGSLDDGRRRCRWGCRSGGCRRCLPRARQRPELPLSDARAPAGRAGEPRRWAPRCRWGCRSGGCRRCHPRAPAGRAAARASEQRCGPVNAPVPDQPQPTPTNPNQPQPTVTDRNKPCVTGPRRANPLVSRRSPLGHHGAHDSRHPSRPAADTAGDKFSQQRTRPLLSRAAQPWPTQPSAASRVAGARVDAR